MKNNFIINVLLIMSSFSAFAQNESIEQKGDVGFTLGAAHYFGDLNPRTQLNDPKIALGAFYRKQFSNYIGVRLSAHYAQLGYSDSKSKVAYQQLRNLSFNTNIWELALQGDFNFFKYIPSDPKHSFTPYITFGIGTFLYNPYAYLNNQKVYLRDLGTEGQNIGYVDASGKKRTPYKNSSICLPIGMGIKYSINENINFSFSLEHRLTFTDYIDDVSTTYVGINKFSSSSTASLLQDRSYATINPAIGLEGRQRGWSKQKDQYIIAEVGISFNLKNYRCPTTGK